MVPEAMPIPNVPLIQGEIPTNPSEVELKKNNDGTFRVFINGTETPIHGVSGVKHPGLLERLKVAGGNFVRTCGINDLEVKVHGDERLIDRAYRLGFHVMVGIWVGHQRHGFDYHDRAQLEKQRQHVRESVQKYKDHPAVIMWGLGNEMEGLTSKTGEREVWKELEVLAQIIKKEDSNHPVMTVIAGVAEGKIHSIQKFYPSIDALGVNYYGGAAHAGEALKKAGWTKPFALTEFGARGFWEVKKASWGAPIEQHSSEKADHFLSHHMRVFEKLDGKELCLGTFAFTWGWKQERTATWFGMHLPTMEKLPQVDAMTKAWTGKWPAVCCPTIKVVDASFYCDTVAPNTEQTAYIGIKGALIRKMFNPLQYDWVVWEESQAQSSGGDEEYTPPSFPELTKVNGKAECVFTTPEKPGAYRLFVTVRDRQGGAATANIPFKVE